MLLLELHVVLKVAEVFAANALIEPELLGAHFLHDPVEDVFASLRFLVEEVQVLVPADRALLDRLREFLLQKAGLLVDKTTDELHQQIDRQLLIGVVANALGLLEPLVDDHEAVEVKIERVHRVLHNTDHPFYNDNYRTASDRVAQVG